jgi:hypothetical protein
MLFGILPVMSGLCFSRKPSYRLETVKSQLSIASLASFLPF